MKKNLITVVILALVLANLVLTAILAFTIIPQTRKSNALIDQVCSAINLELEGGQGTSAATIPISDIDPYSIEQGFTVTLADSGDGKKHYAVFSVSLSMNTKSEGYKTFKGAEGLALKESIIQSEINTIVSSYTLEQFNANGYQDVKDEILQALQKMFEDPEFIVGINFLSVTTE